MKKMDLKNLRSALQKKMSTIAERPDKRGDIVIQQSADALDQTQLAAERDLAVTLLNRDAQMYRRLSSALRRMEDETYGTCLACEEPINVKRLHAVPWAE